MGVPGDGISLEYTTTDSFGIALHKSLQCVKFKNFGLTTLKFECCFRIQNKPFRQKEWRRRSMVAVVF